MRSLRFAAASALAATLFSLPSAARAEPPPAGTWPPPGVVALPPPEAPVAAAAPAPEPKKHGSRLPGILVMALGAGGLGAGAVFGVLAMTTGATTRSECSGTSCTSSAAQADLGRTRNFEGASYAAFAAGGTIALTGLILTIVAPGKPESDGARLAPWVGKGSGGLGLTGSF